MSKYKQLFLLPFFSLFLAGLPGLAQEKGVDTQNSGIRDAGSGRAAGSNGAKQDTGAGRGINFGKGRTPGALTLPNPYRLTARRDAVINAVNEFLREKTIVLDADTSRLSEGTLRTQPFVFAKGSVITKSYVERYTEAETSAGRNWTRARHTLLIEVQPIDGTKVNLFVTAKIEGRSDGPTGPEWLTLRSNGTLEQELINSIVETFTGDSPANRNPLDKP
jgi:hypothetical protein